MTANGTNFGDMPAIGTSVRMWQTRAQQLARQGRIVIIVLAAALAACSSLALLGGSWFAWPLLGGAVVAALAALRNRAIARSGDELYYVRIAMLSQIVVFVLGLLLLPLFFLAVVTEHWLQWPLAAAALIAFAYTVWTSAGTWSPTIHSRPRR